MGVKGLWSLLNPVARPVQIESMEGKRLAIDSSIWLYQFQATMRDKDGRVLVNAHVLGFLRRINKLLFHGIKPVFVFDGGAPVLKRSTIAERKRRKAGAAANHARMAERLFAAQMRREVVKSAQAARDEQATRQAQRDAVEASRYDDDAGEQIAEGAVYLEDLEGRPGPSRPRQENTTASSRPAPAVEEDAPDAAELRRRKFKKHDPYRLPEATIPTVSTEDKPDARLATEEELKQFIDEMHPGDIDVDSPEFRALPTEVQYEIIGDLRIRSRQQSHKRLVDMLRAAPSALDFSMAQIKHLSQRNALTQQLLTVTDMVGKAHLTIPVRVAAERNREYVLVKRGENEGGGWALGIREGTKTNPIKVDPDEKPEETDSDDSDGSERDSKIEEVPQAQSPPVDPDLREHRRREMLEAMAARYAPKKMSRPSLDLSVKTFGNRRAPGAVPLFEEEDEPVVPTSNDEALSLALQQEELGSDEDEADEDLARALAQSRKDAQTAPRAKWTTPEVPPHLGSDDSLEEVSLVPSERTTPQTLSATHTPIEEIEMDDEDDFEEVAASFKVAKPIAPKVSDIMSTKALKSVDSALHDVQESPRKAAEATQAKQAAAQTMSAELAHRQVVPMQPAATRYQPIIVEDEADETHSTDPKSTALANPGCRNGVVPRPKLVPTVALPISDPPRKRIAETNQPGGAPETHTVEATPMRGVNRSLPSRPAATPSPFTAVPDVESPVEGEEPVLPGAIPLWSSEFRQPLPPSIRPHPSAIQRDTSTSRNAIPQTPSTEESEAEGDLLEVTDCEDESSDEGEDSREIVWPKSPSPTVLSRPPLHTEQSGETIPSEVEDEDVDMNREDMVAEEDDYARFMAQIKNRDLNEVRTEIDDEIRVLHSQNKVAMRDSDEITQAMIAQIQTLLRHFGIPYITAPMEAEAQCAKLAELNLVDGIITDDSDVFLFGGKQCFKNIFNDSKYAECFLLADIDRELSLTRERLISLAYLLGSDYTIGLPGVGPVVALELLANFPGPTGIGEFKAWWTKVQRGQDRGAEHETKWKKSFKKRYGASIFIQADWPNQLREAYKYPQTDESEEPFHWGFPKLSALRSYLHEELSWSISKVDDELTPIVQRLARRGKVGAVNKQGTLDPFFDLSIGQGNYAPRRRTTANVSKRLMAVIKDFREAEARVTGKQPEGWSVMMDGLDEEDPKGRGTGKRRKSETKSTEKIEVDEVDEADEGSLPKRRKSSSRGRLKRAISSASRWEIGTESVGSSADTGEGVSQRGRVRRTSSRGRGRGRGRGRPPTRTPSGDFAVD